MENRWHFSNPLLCVVVYHHIYHTRYGIWSQSFTCATVYDYMGISTWATIYGRMGIPTCVTIYGHV